MIEGKVIQVGVKVITFSEVKLGSYFILLNEKPCYEGVEVVAEETHTCAYLYLKLHKNREENNAICYRDRLQCSIDFERKVIPIFYLN